VLSHERASRDAPSFLPALQRDLLAVIGRYVTVKEDFLRVNFARPQRYLGARDQRRLRPCGVTAAAHRRAAPHVRRCVSLRRDEIGRQEALAARSNHRHGDLPRHHRRIEGMWLASPSTSCSVWRPGGRSMRASVWPAPKWRWSCPPGSRRRDRAAARHRPEDGGGRYGETVTGMGDAHAAQAEAAPEGAFDLGAVARIDEIEQRLLRRRRRARAARSSPARSSAAGRAPRRRARPLR